MNRCVAKKLLIILLLAITFNSVSFANSQQRLEYKLKALYIVRLAAFISWPENPKKNTFKVCIDSADLVAIELKQTNVTEVKSLKLEIIDPPGNSSITLCDFLYISQGRVDPSLANFPVVTVSSQNNFAEQGGMIEFYIDQSKVRMKANLQAVNKAGIKLSSKLIRLLKIVKPLESKVIDSNRYQP